MAANYVSIMSDIFMANNPNLNRSEADALSWVGLHGTIAYDALTSDQKNASNVANAIGRGATSSSSTSSQSPC